MGPSVARPLVAAPAGPMSAVLEWQQTTTAQAIWVVNFYSTTKTKQYTVINATTMSRRADTPLVGNAIEMEVSLETASE